MGLNSSGVNDETRKQISSAALNFDSGNVSLSPSPGPDVHERQRNYEKRCREDAEKALRERQEKIDTGHRMEGLTEFWSEAAARKRSDKSVDRMGDVEGNMVAEKAEFYDGITDEEMIRERVEEQKMAREMELER